MFAERTVLSTNGMRSSPNSFFRRRMPLTTKAGTCIDARLLPGEFPVKAWLTEVCLHRCQTKGTKNFLQAMKKLVVVVLLLAGIQTGAAAQSSRPSGYWVTESNPGQKTATTVRFYTEEHLLIYEEKVDKVRLNIERRRVVKRLNKALRLALNDWAMKKQQNEPHYVAALFK
jgi:hypothetical protein